MNLRWAGMVVGAGLGVVVGLGCADLPPIQQGECGNGVVDNGEDCDLFADQTLGAGTVCGATCRYVCDADQLCPTGWGCGGDDVCRAASGKFAELPGASFPADAFGMISADVDGDGQPDLIGLGNSLIFARFGEPDGTFPIEYDFAIDVGVSALAFGDLNGDLRHDLVVPVPAGFITLVGDDDRDFEPVPYSVFIDQADGGMLLLPILADPFSPFLYFLIIAATSTEFQIVVQPVGPQKIPTPPVTLPDYHTVDEIAGLAIANVDPGPPSAEELVLAFVGESRVRLFGVGFDMMGLPFATFRDEIATPAPVVTSELHVGDVDGDGAPDLIIPVQGNQVAVAYGDGAGGFAAAVVDPRFAALEGPTEPTSTGPLAVADLTGDGRADYVGEEGIFLNLGGMFVQTSWNSTGIPWFDAVVADVNRDFVPDVAVSNGTRTIEIRHGSTSGFFSRAQVVTDGYPFGMRTGDFDGDQIADVAYGEHLASGDALSVIFGATDGHPTEPVNMGSFSIIDNIEAGNLAVGPSTIDATTDLMVQHSENFEIDAPRSLAIFIGTAQRRMLSPFSIGVDPSILVVGRFTPGGDPIADVLAMTPAGAVLSNGLGNAAFRQDQVYYLGPVGMPGDTFVDCAIWTSGDLDGDGVDEAIALGGGPRCPGDASLTVIRFLGTPDMPMMDATTVDLPYHTPIQAQLDDLDQDGRPDLIVVYSGDLATGLGAGIVVYWNDAGAELTASPTVIPAFDGTFLRMSASPIAADVDRELELAVASDLGVWVLDLDVASRVYQMPTGPAVDGFVLTVLGVDVTDDDLEDLIVFDGFEVHIYAAVPTGSN